MINKSRLIDVLEKYKANFVSKQWKEEKYKWEAVKCFQEHWDVNAVNFPEMLSKSLSMTFNLLTSMNNFPKGMIETLAKKAPEEVRATFISLFDESRDVVTRISEFKSKYADLLKYDETAKQHYQYENAISTYLWLRYPDKYYIYKYSEVRVMVEALDCGVKIKKGAYAENLRIFLDLYDELSLELKKDQELVDMLNSQISNTCYPDPELKTLAIDVGFYISRTYKKDEIKVDDWYPADYSPGLTVKDWVALLKDESVFNLSSLEIMKRMKDFGGQATGNQLAAKYGESANFYNSESSSLSRRVAEKTKCLLLQSSVENDLWWPILYVRREAENEEKGSYVLRLREELSKALEIVDLSHVNLFVTSRFEEMGRNYWWLNANPKIWSFSKISIGEEQAFTLYSESGNKRKIFQNFLDAKIGDKIICYESNPVKQIVALGRISLEQDGEKIQIEKVENLTSPLDYLTLKSQHELEKMEYFNNSYGSLFKLTKSEYDCIYELIREENPLPIIQGNEKYSKENFLDEVYMTEDRYDLIVSVLKNKKNIILQGAPGVGKTFAAKRLAWSILEEKDDTCIEFVQFHQNYSYEDFMMGYKPVDDGFELKYGVFYQCCQKAANRPDKDHFFIIDEINRGNMSKIFGELLMLIERDYRDSKITLAYNGMLFSVPNNLHIIGMMNTADRSLAMIDYALRRRFSFFEMEPGFATEGFIKYQRSLNDETLNDLIQKTQELNKEIAKDRSLGKGFSIGHSYFCGQKECSEEWLHSIIEFDILPMLSEYWFDDLNKLQYWTNMLRGVFQ